MAAKSAKWMVVALMSGSLLAACAANRSAQPGPDAAAAAAAAAQQAAAASAYVQAAESFDQFEIQSSQLALQLSTNPNIRAFAQNAINNHGQLASRLSAAAQASGVPTGTAMLMPQHATLISQLRYATPVDFDATYKNMQAMALMQAADLHQQYAATGGVPALREHAQGALPAIQAELSQAQLTRAQAIDLVPPIRPPSSRRAGERG